MNNEVLNYDVVVVGAGPAGSTAAYECAKSGLKVLMLEEDQCKVMGLILQLRHK